MLKDYREPEDLLSDESFLSWYFHPERNPGNEWERWMKEVPAREQLVQHAIILLETTVLREKELPAGQLQQAEAALLQKIAMGARVTEDGDAASVVELPPAGQSLSGYRSWRFIAAACILLVLGGAMIVMRIRSSGEQQLVTHFGQLSVQHLPDGTEVTMNANTQIRYADNWKEGKDREVWVEGEAFFHVRKTPNHSTFVVHTDPFDIVVTGTQFNVVNRPDKANILLHEGSVTLHGKDGREMKLSPGDFVQWDEQGLDRRGVQRDSVLAWKDRKLFFDNTPLKEVVKIIEEQYGVKVQIADQSIVDHPITGILPNNNLEKLLNALEATPDFEVTNSNGNILIKARTR